MKFKAESQFAHRCTVIQLSPLARPELASMANHLLASAEMPEDFRAVAGHHHPICGENGGVDLGPIASRSLVLAENQLPKSACGMSANDPERTLTAPSAGSHALAKQNGRPLHSPARRITKKQANYFL